MCLCSRAESRDALAKCLDSPRNCACVCFQYDVEVVGRCGGGGEYAPQAGFGWTNGLCFELLDQYGLIASSKDDPGTTTSALQDSGKLKASLHGETHCSYVVSPAD